MLVGGLVAFGAYKLSTRDAKRIEDQSGIPPEDMTDEQLEQSMDDLGIEKQTRDADDVEQGAAPAGSAGQSDVDQLAKLATLHEQGALTDDEFTSQKAKIIGI
jgi:hypothetical protein